MYYTLNEKVMDTVTGFTGKITGRAEYVGREMVYLIEAVDSTGRPIEVWLPAGRLDSIVTGDDPVDYPDGVPY